MMHRGWGSTVRAAGRWLVCGSVALLLSGVAVAMETAVTHIVQEGDTLFDLSEHYLDDPLLWPELGRANGLTDPYRVPLGTRMEIPLELLRRKAGGATVVHVSGTVTRARAEHAAEPLIMSERVVDGDTIETAPDGFVTLELADGSHVRIIGDSVVHMQRLRYVVRRKRSDTLIEMDKGRVESSVPRPASRGSRFRIQSPLMAAGVRGTHFGVTVTGSGAVTSDVLEGSVAAVPRAGGDTVVLRAGHGTVATASHRVAAPSRLLSAPDLDPVPALHQRPLLDLAFPAVAGAHGYRVYVARDLADLEVVANDLVAQPRARFPDLPDGRYFLSVRAVDASGIEGRPARRKIELDARPLPPMTVAPEHTAQLGEGDVQLRWAMQPEIAFYEFELASDAEFLQSILASGPVTESGTQVHALASGTYYWRVRAVQRLADGSLDRGPFGDPRQFGVRRDIALAPSQDAEHLRVRWEGEPGQRFRLQVATSAAFTELVADQELAEREADLGELPGGEYYLRVQVTDADGYVRPYTDPQVFRVRGLVRTDTSGLLRDSANMPVERGS